MGTALDAHVAALAALDWIEETAAIVLGYPGVLLLGTGGMLTLPPSRASSATAQPCVV